MCTGIGEAIALAGLAASAAGTGVSISAAAQAREAMNRRVVQGLRQQQEFSRQAQPVFQESLQKAGPTAVEGQLSEGQRRASELYREVTGSPQSVSPLPIDEARLRGQVGQSQQAQAALQGYSNYALQQWLRNQQAGRELGVISDFASQTGRLTPVLTQLAGGQSADLAGIGSLISTAGNLSGIYGGLNWRRRLAGQPNPVLFEGDINVPDFSETIA